MFVSLFLKYNFMSIIDILNYLNYQQGVFYLVPPLDKNFISFIPIPLLEYILAH